MLFSLNLYYSKFEEITIKNYFARIYIFETDCVKIPLSDVNETIHKNREVIHMKNFFRTKKGRITLAVVILLVVATIVAAVLILKKGEEEYRLIVADEVSGEVVVSNDEKDKADVYAGEHLYDGDTVYVGEDSYLTMEMDSDKYILAEENSEFSIKAKGKEGDSNTVIELKEGALLSRLENKLNDGETYKVSTPNVTMSVRGTVFCMEVYWRGDDVYSKLDVYEGEVVVEIQKDGKTVEESILVGESVLIKESNGVSEYVADEDGNTKRPIAYDELSENTIKTLLEYIDEGANLCISEEKLKEYLENIDEDEIENNTEDDKTDTEDNTGNINSDHDGKEVVSDNFVFAIANGGNATVKGITESYYNELKNKGRDETVRIDFPAKVEIESDSYTVVDIKFDNSVSSSWIIAALQEEDMPLQEWYLSDTCKNFTGFSEYEGADFNNYNMVSIDFANVEVIEEEALKNAEFMFDVTIPASVKEVGNKAFLNCSSLSTVVFEPEFDGEIHRHTFDGCPVVEFTLPIAIKEDAKVIDAAQNCMALEKIIVPEGVVAPGPWLLGDPDCVNVTEVVLPNTLEKMEDYTIWGYPNLKRVEIPSSVKSISSWAIRDGGRLEVIVYNGVEYTDNDTLTQALMDAGLTSYSIKAFDD